jgi:drug/metabolite transporter (DMT)-like permease
MEGNMSRAFWYGAATCFFFTMVRVGLLAYAQDVSPLFQMSLVILIALVGGAIYLARTAPRNRSALRAIGDWVLGFVGGLILFTAVFVGLVAIGMRPD